MSSDSYPKAVNGDTILKHQERRPDSQDHENDDYNDAQEAALPDSSTNEHSLADDSSDINSSGENPDAKEHAPGDELSETNSCDEHSGASEDSTNDSPAEQDREEMNEINTSLDNESTEQSNDGLIFSHAEVQQIGECFKHVVNECSDNNFTNELSSRAGEVLNRSVDMATKMAKGEKVQQAILRQARSDSSFIRHLNELGEDLDVLKTPPLRNRRRRKLKPIETGNGGDSRKVPWYVRFLDALWKLCNQLCKLGTRTINVVVNKIMDCFSVARTIAHKIFRAIQSSLLWIKRAIVDPEGEIKKILDDPEKSSPAKALGVIGVVATAIIGALLLACSIAETGPYGVSVAAIGAAASAMFRQQPSPDHRDNSIRGERVQETETLE